MGRILISPGGGGGTSSDELTATKAQVLAGYTAVTKDSNDESIVGTMPDNNSTTSNGTVPGISESYPNVPTREADNLQYNVGTDSIARISMCPPKGYYSGGGGSYINRPASDFGNATANRVVAGNTFTSSAGIKVSGTIVDRGLYQYGDIGEGTDYYAINSMPEGWYHSDGNSWAPEARISKTTLRNYLGVNAANIRSGTSIAGVAGTLSVQSAISFSAAAISYNTIRISWKNPAKGPWQGVFIQMSTSGNPGTGGGSRAYTGRGNSSSANASNYVDITGLSANTTYYFTCTSYVDNLGWGTSYNVNAKTPLPSGKSILDGLGISVAGGYGYDKHTGSVCYLSGGSWNGNRYRCGGEEPGEDGTAYWRVSGTLAGSHGIGLSLSNNCYSDVAAKLVSQLKVKIGSSANVGSITRTWGGAITSENSKGTRTFSDFRTYRSGYNHGQPVYDLLIEFKEEFDSGTSFYIDL